MNESIRIARFLARAGVGSRRACDALISAGRVRVNGQTILEPGSKVVPNRDRVEFDGEEMHWPIETITGMLHKPAGYVTSCQDPQGRAIVLDLLPDDVREARVFPVGRLDRETEGLLLFTNDGDLAFRLTHPRFGVEKTYLAWVKGKVETSAAERLRNGVMLDDGPTSPAKIRVLRSEPRESRLEIRIHEGRKRQVRRMCMTVGHRVQRLVRTQVGPLELGNLESGAWRLLDGKELSSLKAVCGFDQTDSM